METREVTKLDLLSDLMKQHVAESQTSSLLENFIPDDFVEVCLKAMEKLQSACASNVVYLLAKALVGSDKSKQLPLESISFRLLHLLLLSIVESHLDNLEVCSLEFLEELEIVELNKAQFLPGLNEILFPTKQVKYDMAPKKPKSMHTFVLKQNTFQQDNTNMDTDNEMDLFEQSVDDLISEIPSDIKIPKSKIESEGESENEVGELFEESIEDMIQEESTQDMIPEEDESTENADIKTEKSEDLVTLYKCVLCEVVFKDLSFMSEHVKEAHGQTETKDGPSSNLVKLNQIQSIKNEPMDDGDNKDKHKTPMQRQRIKIDPEKTCSLCLRTFENPIDKDSHEAMKDCLTCKECNLTFRENNKWMQHHRLTHNKTRNVCPICNKDYHRPCHLFRHIRSIHNKQRKHECPTCGQQFFELRDLRHHQEKQSCSTSEMVDCPVCSKSHRSMFLLRRHVGEIHGMQFCKHCSKTFASSQEYTRHMVKTHWREKHRNDNRELVCDICGQVYHGLLQLKRHVSLKHGPQKEKKEACQLCDKKFYNKSYLKRHIEVVHDKIKSHYCEVCGRGFCSQSALLEHVGVHDNISRYTCESCGEGFVHRASYKRHVIKHLGPQMFPCTICHRKFDNPEYLKSHVKRVHKGTRVEISNFEIPGTSLPENLRKQRYGGRKSNRGFTEMTEARFEITLINEKGDQQAAEVTRQAAVVDDLIGEQQVEKQEQQEVYTVDDQEGGGESITEMILPVGDEGAVEADLSGLQLVQVEEEGGTSQIYYVPIGTEYIKVGDNTISLE